MGEESSAVTKGNVKGPMVAGTVLHLDCITVKILTMMLSYSFARCNHWGKLAKDTQNLYYFLKLQVKLQLSKSKRFKFFKKKKEHAMSDRHSTPQETVSQGKCWGRREMLK